jgi:hypothetical protein
MLQHPRQTIRDEKQRRESRLSGGEQTEKEQGKSLRNVYSYNLALLLLPFILQSGATSPLDVEYSIMDHFYLPLRLFPKMLQSAWGSRKIIFLCLSLFVSNQ